MERGPSRRRAVTIPTRFARADRADARGHEPDHQRVAGATQSAASRAAGARLGAGGHGRPCAATGRVRWRHGHAGGPARSGSRRPVVEQVRERPVPIALAGAGVGLAWWLMRRASSRQTWSRDDMYNWDDDTTGTYDYTSATTRHRLRDDRIGGAGRVMAGGCACCATIRYRPRSRRPASATCSGVVARGHGRRLRRALAGLRGL